MSKEKQEFTEDFKWTVENEICLFEAMKDFKVVGTNRFFNMALVIEKLAEMNIFLSAEALWEKINSMYDIEALNEMETLCPETVDFELPSEFSDQMKIRSNIEETTESVANKVVVKPKPEIKETPKVVPKREEKVTKITPRRDSVFKETGTKIISPPKPVVKTETDKKNVVKTKSRKSSDMSLSPGPSSGNRNSRSTRGSVKPEESTPTRGRSPIMNNKRRTRTDLK